MKMAYSLIPAGVTEFVDTNTPLTWDCVDCGMNTAPGFKGRLGLANDIAIHGVSHGECNNESELYFVHDAIWKRAGILPFGGCLCVGCLEKRIGRKLKPKDFDWSHPFNQMPGTKRLINRRGRLASVLEISA
jgi:hypothetical protein